MSLVVWRGVAGRWGPRAARPLVLFVCGGGWLFVCGGVLPWGFVLGSGVVCWWWCMYVVWCYRKALVLGGVGGVE